MFRSRIFTAWFAGALVLWLGLFAAFNDFAFVAAHWQYPAIMVLGAFVAGVTPEGGGAVAFPFLSVFLEIDRGLARDFSLMIQSVGMTSASIFILSNRANDRAAYRPALWFAPVAFAGFAVGMATLQATPVIVIQALFLSLIMTFAIAYAAGALRGDRPALTLARTSSDRALADRALIVATLFTGGMVASLFGTGADIVLYALLVTRFRMQEKIATHLSIITMAAVSLFGFGWRHFVDAGLTADQVRTWLSAYPVVLFMAPLGAFVLHRINTEWMLRGVVALNIFQMLYFNLKDPSVEKLALSAAFSVALFAGFRLLIGARGEARNRAQAGTRRR